MELKPYQQQILDDLERFLNILQQKRHIAGAFNEFWTHHLRTPLVPCLGKAVEPYKDNVPSAPHICVKVPTAGGKTFIACNALRTIYNSFDLSQYKTVVWLVPSITILEQTLRNLQNPRHPYRRCININFGNRVEVFNKQQALMGAGFNQTCARENLCILVMSFDSFRTNNKDGRKVYQENGYLQSFQSIVKLDNGDAGEVQLMSVLRSLRPVVIVDESHNAETDLSIEMLRNLNPSFILDLTATPRKNSNIISFTDALELRKENMVKLPVIVYNLHNKNDVISSALQLRRSLEKLASKAKIRPIILFQAQPRTGEENTTFEKIKEILIAKGISEEQIKIKTADRNELKNIDLMDKDCPVRYIITVNALKEGWDCPFAYILASLADKSSSVDVEQILGRILRLPYVRQNNNSMLNMSYVLTASNKFMDTLDNIVKGLNRAGFSEKDYRVAEQAETTLQEVTPQPIQTPLFDEPNNLKSKKDDELAAEKINYNSKSETESSQGKEVDIITRTALSEDEACKRRIEETKNKQITIIPTSIEKQVKTYPIENKFRISAERIKIPQFYCKVPALDLFDTSNVLLNKEILLEYFQLSSCDASINFTNVDSNMYRVDLDQETNEHRPAFYKIEDERHMRIVRYILDPSHKSARVKNCRNQILEAMGNMYPIADSEIKLFVERVLFPFTDEQFSDLLEHIYSYSDRIKQRINELAQAYIEKQFEDGLKTDKIFLKPSYSFPQNICPIHTGKPLRRSLYEKEGEINGFEEQVINEVANMDNVEFWTRNLERKGFCINGFINHYPDFIVRTTKRNIVVLETKGDHLDADKKIKLGNLWEHIAGRGFKYCMVYNERHEVGAQTLNEFLKIMQEL